MAYVCSGGQSPSSRINTFTALYYKGYHTGSEFRIASGLGIHTLVAVPAIGRRIRAPNPRYNVEHFVYDKGERYLHLPAGPRTERQRGHGTGHGTTVSGSSRPGPVRTARQGTSVPPRKRTARSSSAASPRPISKLNAARVCADPGTYKKRAGNGRASLRHHQKAMGL